MQTGTHSTGTRKALLALLATSAISSGAGLTIQSTSPDSMSLHLSPDPLSYFYLRQSTDLTNFTPFSMVLGDHATTWPLSTAEIPTRFFRITQISLFAPEDTDGDGIDDVYEIRHPILNPLDASDAAFQSGNGNLTFLQEYQSVLGVDPGPPEIFSREVSSFNFGEALGLTTSREVSVFNLGPALFTLDAISPEISIFNGDNLPQSVIAQVYSREVSSFNFGAPLASEEAISRNISVFNGDPPPSSEIAVVHSREVSSFNFGNPLFATDAVSREISAFNFGTPSSPVDVISREMSIINNTP